MTPQQHAGDGPTLPILGVALSRLGMERGLAACEELVRQRQGGFVCFVSLHTMLELDRDPAFRQLCNGARFAFADGVPVQWLSQLKRRPVAERVPGPDFMAALLARLRDLPHGFVGGLPGVAERVARRHGVTGHALSPPQRPFSTRAAADDWERLLDGCPDRTAPPVCWVGLGCPKQERWMAAVTQRAPRTTFFGVGAAFDFLAGDRRRAPRPLRRLGLEWLFRLVQEPRRLGRRYLLGVPTVPWLGLKDLLGAYPDPPWDARRGPQAQRSERGAPHDGDEDPANPQ